MDLKVEQMVDFQKLKKEFEERRKVRWDEFYTKYDRPFDDEELSISEEFPKPLIDDKYNDSCKDESDLCIEVSDGSDDEGITEDDINPKEFTVVFKQQCQQKIEMFQKTTEEETFEKTKTGNERKSRRTSIITKERRTSIQSPMLPSKHAIKNVINCAENLEAIGGNNKENSLALVPAHATSQNGDNDMITDEITNQTFEQNGITYIKTVKTVQTVTQTIILVKNGEGTPVGTPNKDSKKTLKNGHSTKRKPQTSNTVFFNDDSDDDDSNGDCMSPPKSYRSTPNMNKSRYSSPSAFSTPRPNSKNASIFKEIVLSTPMRSIRAKNRREQQVVISAKDTQKIVRNSCADIDTKCLRKLEIWAKEDEKVCLELTQGKYPLIDVDDDLLAVQDKQTINVVKHVYK